MTHLLDTSALLAHAFEENGWELVQALLDDNKASVGISALSLYECDRRLVELRFPSRERREFSARYSALLDHIAPVDEKVCAIACELRDAATSRLAAVDILIAATARVHGAVFVHRDAHFAAIPAAQLRQLVLPEK